MFGKFIRVFWVGAGGKDKGKASRSYICDVKAFGSSGTATYPGHKFVVTPLLTDSVVLTTWTIEAGNSLYYYDPFNFDYSKAVQALSAEQFIICNIPTRSLPNNTSNSRPVPIG